MIDGQERITLEGGEHLSPDAAAEVQDWIAKRWLMLHTPIPRRTIQGVPPSQWGDRDRRQCVRDTVDPKPDPVPFPHPWRFNQDPVLAELRRHDRPPSKTPEAEHARYLRRREGMTAATRE